MSPLQKGKPTAETAAPMFASSNPDEMVQGGLMDDFDGLVIKARYVPWNYAGNLDHYVLGVALTIQPYDDKGQPDGDPFTQTYSAGELDQFVPSDENGIAVDLGVDEVGEEQEGTHALRVGNKTGLNNNTNYAFVVQKLIEAGFDSANLSPDIRFWENVFGHWNRIPQKKRSGIVAKTSDNGKPKRDDILVLTELKETPAAPKRATAPAKPPASGSVKPAAKAAPAKAASAQAQSQSQSSSGGGDLDDRLRAVVGAAVKAAGELPKSKLGKLAIDNFAGVEKGKAVKRIGETDFLESGAEYADAPWAYDPENATLLYAGE